ncbi:MAG: hypothetical protein K8L97_06125 [Anaerolineae bacterium]|nr:hypothetical protein [Anaerolineae bacterium]
MSDDDIRALAKEYARELGEFENVPRAQIRSIIQICGVDFAKQIFERVLEIEAQGGTLVPDNSRRRTIGGLFLYLVRHEATDEQRLAIFPLYKHKKKAAGDGTEPPQQQPSFPSLIWEERAAIIQRLLDEKGEASTVKVTLIGRPGKMEMRKDVVVTTMQHTAKTGTFPKGIPVAPEDPTLYTVYIAAKQWRKIEESLTDPEDAMIIEGSCAYDPEVGGMVVYTQSVTTKLIEAQKRQAQKEAAAAEKGEEAPKPPKQPPQPKPQKPAEPPKPVSRVFAPPSDIPHDVSQKLNELYASAALFRQKISTIQAKPAGQQFGLEMTQKLLKNVEDEIAGLESKYVK